ncbi:expressed unknown protein [Ectocarpus siliculosus]|uniref:Uncharacterized protein n=1 Tax=Ectocarpus siliculosus TaxID=2880 RepID=D8LAZ5_ECTSI|nr:expressed unknown protein [Ectocarpus siliculosus]|eukprot:CBN76504.1 expressed unknown protein [Ectocarpus siliculosus]
MDKKGSGDLFDDLFGFSKSRPSPPPRREAVDLDAIIDSDDEFSLPDTPPRPTPPPATEKIKSPTQVGGGAADEGGGISGGGAAAAEPREADGHDYAKIKSKSMSKPKFDQTELEVFPQDCPAIVVPEHLHIFAKVKAPPDGVMAYGPRAKSVTPSRNRFVILQFLPLCLTCHAKPETPYACVRGKPVESVLPYNTVMAGKKAGQDRALGPEDSWADADYHFRKAKGKSKQLSKQNWDVTLEHAQKFLSRALELKAKKVQEDEEESRRAEQELELRRQQRELEEEEEGESSAGEDGGEGADDDIPKYSSKSVQMERGLPLAPGDRIFYWDRTKIVGLASSRREATILEIRGKKAAKEANVELLVLDNHQVVLNDWVIQRYIKDEDTGEMQLDYRGAEVHHYKLKRGKLEGVDQRRHERMETLVDGFRKSITAYGAGDQLRNAPKRRSCESSGGGGDSSDADDDATGRSRKRSKAAAKKAQSSTTAAAANGGGGAASVACGSGGGARSVGRKESPLGEEDAGHAIAASIAKSKKRTKPKVRVEPENEQETKGTDDEQEVEDVSEASIAEAKMKPKARAEPESEQQVKKKQEKGTDDEQEVEDVTEASISKGKKKTKPKVQAEPGKEQNVKKKQEKGTDDKPEVEDVTEASIVKAKEKMRARPENQQEIKKQEATTKGRENKQEVVDVSEEAEGEGKERGQRVSKAAPTAAAAASGRGGHANDSSSERRPEKEVERVGQKIKEKREKGREAEAQEGAVGPSKKRSGGDGGKGGGDRNRQAPAPIQTFPSRGGGGSSNNVDGGAESRETNKRKNRPPALPAASSGEATTGRQEYMTVQKKPKLNVGQGGRSSAANGYVIPKKTPERDAYWIPKKKQGGGSTDLEWRVEKKSPEHGGGSTGGGGWSESQRRHMAFTHDAARRNKLPKFKQPRPRAGQRDG